MFTGITEEVGTVQTITNKDITVKCSEVLNGTKIGDSIAVNGACLTVTKISEDGFTADVSPETFRVTALNTLKAGSFVNLERALKADGRFGGHIVSGHVDGIAKIKNLTPHDGFYNLEIELQENESRYVIRKGSITVNGISLTIADVNEKNITIAVIPHTYENTCLKYLKNGDFVNIEADILAKYVEKFLSTSDNRSRINLDFLQRNGFC